MQVLINGETRNIENELNLRELLEKLELPTTRIAIELNKDVVRKKDWESIKISDADKIEIIHFVGGG
jgi:sulfur carrier protein